MLHGYKLLKCSNASCIFKGIIIYMSSVVAPHLLSTMLQSKRPRAAGTGHSRAAGTQTATQRDTARRHQLEPRVQAGRGLRRLPPQAPAAPRWPGRVGAHRHGRPLPPHPAAASSPLPCVLTETCHKDRALAPRHHLPRMRHLPTKDECCPGGKSEGYGRGGIHHPSL